MGEGARMREDHQLGKHMYVYFFGRWWMLIDHIYMNVEQSRALVDFVWLKYQTMLYFKYGPKISLAFVLHVVVMNGKTVNPQNGLVDGIVYHSPLVNVSDRNCPSWRRTNLLSH